MPEISSEHAAAAAMIPSYPDAHGEAALHLVESILHELVARSVLSSAQAVTAVQTALDVQSEVCLDRGGGSAEFSRAEALLGAIKVSLGADDRIMR